MYADCIRKSVCDGNRENAAQDDRS
jgi:hypothetical protein